MRAKGCLVDKASPDATKLWCLCTLTWNGGPPMFWLANSCCLVFVFYLTTSFFLLFFLYCTYILFQSFSCGNEQLPLASHHAIPCFFPGVHSATSCAPGISWKHHESNYQRRQASRLSRWRPNCAVGMPAQVSKFGKTNLLRTETFVSGVETNFWPLTKPLFLASKQPFLWAEGTYGSK